MSSILTGQPHPGASSGVGAVSVVTTQNKGLDPEFWAEQCMKRIMSVSNQSAAPIKDQALAYQDDIRRVLVHYFKEAVKSERTTIYNLLIKGGAADVAEHIRRM